MGNKIVKIYIEPENTKESPEVLFKGSYSYEEKVKIKDVILANMELGFESVVANLNSLLKTNTAVTLLRDDLRIVFQL